MQIERTKNAVRNIFFGLILKIYQIFIPFAVRTLMIYFMGMKYLGLNSLFVSILQVLNLAELGVGSAMIYSMYQPIAKNDTKSICVLMNLYRTYYRIIGLVIAFLGICIAPFLPYLIKKDLPTDINLYVLYFLNLSVTVMSYWLFSYKNSILQAMQRMDIISKISLLISTLQFLLQVIVIILWKNYYLFVLVMLAMQIVNNLLTAYYANRMYPDCLPYGHLSKEEKQVINRRIRDIFTARIGSTIVNSADTIVISTFLGLSVLAIYQNYFYLLTAVSGFIFILFQSITAGIGNSLVVESNEKNFSDFNKLTFLIVWMAGVCTCCFLCLYQIFMTLWVGERYLLSFSVVICFCLYFFVTIISGLLNLYKDASGIWHKDKWRTLITALSNLILNILTIHSWGVYGVILSTVLSTILIGMPWLIHNLFTVLFERKQMYKFLYRLCRYVLVTFINCVLCYEACSFITSVNWLTLIIRLLLCLIISNLLYYFAYKKMSEFQDCLRLIDNVKKNFKSMLNS